MPLAARVSRSVEEGCDPIQNPGTRLPEFGQVYRSVVRHDEFSLPGEHRSLVGARRVPEEIALQISLAGPRAMHGDEEP